MLLARIRRSIDGTQSPQMTKLELFASGLVTKSLMN
jgi:hypothetical protein